MRRGNSRIYVCFFILVARFVTCPILHNKGVQHMYSTGLGGGTPLTGVASTVSGVAILPNTGGSVLLSVIAVANLIIGATIIVSTLARYMTKKAHNA